MNISDLECLALYHEDIASSQSQLATDMLGEVAAGFRASATRHATWALQIRELIASFQTLTRP